MKTIRIALVQAATEALTLTLAPVTIAGLLGAVPTLSVFAETDGSLIGVVTGSAGVAIPNAQIIWRSTKTEASGSVTSSSQGKYQIDGLGMGDYQISVLAPGYAPFETSISIVSGGNSYNISLNSTDATSQQKTKEMIVEVKSKRRHSRSTGAQSRTELKKEEIAKLPQGMESSLPRVLSMTTPGVVQGSFGQMFFRGNHANIQYQIDGVQLPDSPSNTFGQSISLRNVETMEVITGGIPAEYGQRSSAVVNIVTKSGPVDTAGDIELNYGSYNTWSPHALLGGADESGKLHYFLSLNYNQTDRGLDTPQPASETDHTQGGTESIHNKAEGNSEFLKLDWLADDKNKLSVIFFHSYNRFQIPNYPASFGPGSPYFQPGFTDNFGNVNLTAPTYNYVPSDTDNVQSETNAYTQVVWKHMFSQKFRMQIAPYYRYSLVKVKNDPVNDLAAVTNNLPPRSQNVSFGQNRHSNNLGLKTDFHYRPTDDHLVKTGFQVQASRSDGWISFQQSVAAVPFSDSSPTIGFFEGAYIQDDFSFARSWVLNAGLRFDAAQFSFGGGTTTTDSLLQPRVGLTFLATDTLKFHAFYGRLFQPAPVENLRYTYTLGSFSAAPFDLKAQKDHYFEVGTAYEFLPKQTAILNVYYKDSVNVLDDHQLLNTSIAQPYNFAKGYAYGAEFSVKGQINEDWSEYFNYSYGIAKGLDSSGGIGISTGGAGYQVLDHVQSHTANAGVTYSKNSIWWTLQGLFGSGLRTGPNNDISLPSHFTMDTTLGYQFGPKEGLLSGVRISGDILNILNNVYPITIANGFNGSHYAAGRQFFVRMAKTF